MIESKRLKFKYTFSFAGPVYIDIPMTQLLSYYPQLNINPVGLKNVELAQPPLQLASDTTQQIALPVYTPIYNQNQLVSPVKTGPYQYSTIVPVTYAKVNLTSKRERKRENSFYTCILHNLVMLRQISKKCIIITKNFSENPLSY